VINIKQSFNLFIRKHSVKFKNNLLLVESPSGSKSSHEEIYSAFLKNYSGKYLMNRTDTLAEKFGFTVNKVFIRGQKTRWGSCSSKGNLSFNYMLMKYRKEVIDYVIIHELCHLREMNHSGKFWFLVEKFCPDYNILKKELKNKPINI
jgi:predicted metal-dependent hydrolase